MKANWLQKNKKTKNAPQSLQNS